MLFLLSLLPRSKDARYSIVIGLLVALLIFCLNKMVTLNNEIASKPKVEIHTVVETKVVEKQVAGPVVIREKIIRVPGGAKTTERVIERGPVTTEKGSDVAKFSERIETPILTAQRLWSMTVSINPVDYQSKPAFGFSRSFGIIDIGYSHDMWRGATLKDGQHLNLGVRIF